MGAGLLAGVWSESDPMNLAWKALFSGVLGFLIGVAVGQIFTVLLKEHLDKVEFKVSESAMPENEEKVETPIENRRLEPWNPPRVELKAPKEGS